MKHIQHILLEFQQQRYIHLRLLVQKNKGVALSAPVGTRLESHPLDPAEIDVPVQPRTATVEIVVTLTEATGGKTPLELEHTTAMHDDSGCIPPLGQ